MQNVIRRLHQILLLPVVVLLVIVSLMRIGLHNHPLYQTQVEGWLQDTLGQPVQVADFTVRLEGARVYVNVQEVDIGAGEFNWQYLSFSLDLWQWLEDRKASADKVEIYGLSLLLAQQQDGSWLPQSLASDASPDTGSDIGAGQNIVGLFAQVGGVSLRGSQLTILPLPTSDTPTSDLRIHLEQVAAQFLPLSDGRLSVQLDAQASANTLTPGQVEAVALVGFADDGTVQDLQVEANVEGLHLGSLLSVDVVSLDPNTSVSGQLWLQHDAGKTQVQMRQVDIQGTWAGQPMHWQGNMDVTNQGGKWQWQGTNISGAVGQVKWPFTQVVGSLDQEGLALTTDKLQLNDTVQLVKLLGSDVNALSNTSTPKGLISSDIYTPIVSLAPTGLLHQPRIYWKEGPNSNFLFSATMDSVSVSPWQGVPRVKYAEGSIYLSAEGGKVVINDLDNIHIQLADITEKVWHFDAMQGDIAWRFVDDAVYLDSSPMRLTKEEGHFNLVLGGQFDGDFQVQVDVGTNNIPIQQLSGLMPEVFNIPQEVIDLDLKGDLQVAVRAFVPEHDNSTNASTILDYSITGKGLIGNYPTHNMTISDLNVALRGDQHNLQKAVIDGLFGQQFLTIELVPKPTQKSFPKPLPEHVWQAIDRHDIDLQATERQTIDGLWFRITGNISEEFTQYFLGEELFSEEISVTNWLPQEIQTELYIPSCMVSTQVFCELALGILEFPEKPEPWPEEFNHRQPLAWAWYNHQSSLQKDIGKMQESISESALTLSNGVQNIQMQIGAGRIKGLGVGFEVLAPVVYQGMVINGRIAYVDAESWVSFFQEKSNSQGVEYALLPPLTQLEIQIEKMQWQALKLHEVDIAFSLAETVTTGASSAEQGWAFALNSDEFSGIITNPKNGLPWQVDIERINTSQSLQAEINSPKPDDSHSANNGKDLLSGIQPDLLPDMDIKVQAISIAGQNMGAWQAKVRNQDKKIYIHDLEANFEHSQLVGNMTWFKENHQHQTRFSGRITSEGIANAFADWDIAPSLDSNDGALEVHLGWPASPLAFDIEKSEGDIALRVKKGKLITPPDQLNASKVISLLDFERLLEVVKLNFSDLVQEGFDFDSITAQYNISDGVARNVVPAQFKSSSMELNMQGVIDFNERRVDNDLYVTLPILDKLPFVALLTGSPQLGGVLYVVEKLIGDELATFTSARYSITGDLDKPDIQLEQVFDKNNAPIDVGERANNVFNLQ